jgi:hypothetical protein
MTEYKFTGSFERWAGDPPKVGQAIVEVDWPKLVRILGGKAAFNKTKRCRALNGALVVKFKEKA